MSVARSNFDMFTIGRIAYRREGFFSEFFPNENALLAEKGGWEWECTARAKCAIYDCLVAGSTILT